MLKVLILTLLFFVVGCNNSPKKEQKNTVETTETVENQSVTEDELILRLSGDLFADTSTPEKKNRNIIINYAIDNLLNVQGTRSGLYYEIIEEGEGDLIKWGDKIDVHYKGYFFDGTVFDSSYKRGKPLNFYVGNMIPGWNEGLQLIKPGGKIRLLIPAELAYGDEGFLDGKGRTLVPGNTNLAFEVEVLP